ncbi:MAG: hypothetical protein ABII97_02185 [Patescibacteria group bacterium]
MTFEGIPTEQGQEKDPVEQKPEEKAGFSEMSKPVRPETPKIEVPEVVAEKPVEPEKKKKRRVEDPNYLFKRGEKVRVFGDSGQIEEDWQLVSIDGDGRVFLSKEKEGMESNTDTGIATKIINMRELQKLNPNVLIDRFKEFEKDGKIYRAVNVTSGGKILAREKGLQVSERGDAIVLEEFEKEDVLGIEKALKKKKKKSFKEILAEFFGLKKKKG